MEPHRPQTIPYVPLANVASTAEVARFGRLASERIEDPLFNIVFRALRHEYLEAMAATEPHEDRKRAAIHMQLQVLQDVVMALLTAQIEGVEAEAQIQAMIEREQEELAAGGHPGAPAAPDPRTEYQGFGFGPEGPNGALQG